jgi:GNAT superfamily N-acetyltransferase
MEIRLDTAKTDGARASPLPNGYYKLPPGKLANAVVYLEITNPSACNAPRPTPQGVRLERLTGKDAARFRALFCAIGERWLWAVHLPKSAEQISALLDDAKGEVFAAVSREADVGLVQLEYDAQGNAEIVYFGLVESAVGKGIGRWLAEQVIARAFAKPVRRLWLHTCNFDHPKALRFYQAAGFRIFATGFEIMDDPRVLGLLPRSAAPHVPMVG